MRKHPFETENMRAALAVPLPVLAEQLRENAFMALSSLFVIKGLPQARAEHGSDPEYQLAFEFAEKLKAAFELNHALKTNRSN